VLRIGNVAVEPPFVLAPMAGITDRDFRLLIRRLGGCGLVSMEFISSEGLTRQRPSTLRMLHFVEEERHALSENRGRRQETERLTRQAEENGVQPERLDELVHEIASSHAASINNGGLSEQIEYLVKELGAAEVERILSGPDR